MRKTILLTIGVFICAFFFNESASAQKDSCRCGEWRSVTVTRTFHAPSDGPFNNIIIQQVNPNAKVIVCNGIIEALPGSTYSINSSVMCLKNCTATYTWEIKSSNGTVMSTGSYLPTEITIPVVAGNYRLHLYSKCGGAECKPCIINLVVKEPCVCNGWQVTQAGSIIQNGSTITLSQPATINASLQCGNQCLPSDVRVKVRDASGSLIQTVTGYSLIFNPPTATSGTYRVTWEGNCSGAAGLKSCTVFSFYINWQPPVIVVPHGSWLKGPGSYTFKIGANCPTCNVNATAGQTISLKMEGWSAGGGGAGGGEPGGGTGGNGGGGGGGGSYASETINVVVPAAGTVNYTVEVGIGGAGGSIGTNYVTAGAHGGRTSVQLQGGGNVLTILGGSGGGMNPGGDAGDILNGQNRWRGTSGTNGPSSSSCFGAAGAAGGVGGGPGVINNGGRGGNGGYNRSVVQPVCLAKQKNYGRTAGSVGGNGRVVITW